MKKEDFINRITEKLKESREILTSHEFFASNPEMIELHKESPFFVGTRRKTSVSDNGIKSFIEAILALSVGDALLGEVEVGVDYLLGDNPSWLEYDGDKVKGKARKSYSASKKRLDKLRNDAYLRSLLGVCDSDIDRAANIIERHKLVGGVPSGSRSNVDYRVEGFALIVFRVVSIKKECFPVSVPRPDNEEYTEFLAGYEEVDSPQFTNGGIKINRWQTYISYLLFVLNIKREERGRGTVYYQDSTVEQGVRRTIAALKIDRESVYQLSLNKLVDDLRRVHLEYK